jgi:hypothetical protein
MGVYAEWSPTTYYVVGDIVEYLAGIYEALTINFNSVPPTNPGDWNQIGGTGGVNAINAGIGISVNPIPAVNPTVSINLASSDARLTITNGIGTQRILNNNCVASVSAGTALTASGTNPTGITIDMPNVGTAGTYAFPSSITTDTKGRISAITSGTANVVSVNAGTGITITGPPSTPIVNVANVGTAGTFTNPASITTNAQGQITSITSGTAGSFGAGQISFAAGTNLWAMSSNFWFQVGQSFPAFPQIQGLLWTGGTQYGFTGSVPPAFYNIQFCCPVSDSSTPFSPGTNWLLNSNYQIQVQLTSYDFGAGTLLSIEDTGQCVGRTMIDTATNTKYLTFQITLQSQNPIPVSGFGNGPNIGLQVYIANVGYNTGPPLNYSFNPAGALNPTPYCYIKMGATVI